MKIKFLLLVIILTTAIGSILFLSIDRDLKKNHQSAIILCDVAKKIRINNEGVLVANIPPDMASKIQISCLDFGHQNWISQYGVIMFMILQIITMSLFILIIRSQTNSRSQAF